MSSKNHVDYAKNNVEAEISKEVISDSNLLERSLSIFKTINKNISGNVSISFAIALIVGYICRSITLGVIFFLIILCMVNFYDKNKSDTK